MWKITFLYILLGIIAFIVLLFCIKVKVLMSYDESFSLTIKYLFLHFDIYPSQPKKEEPQKEEKKEEPEKKKDDKPPAPPRENPLKAFYQNQGLSGLLELVGETVRILKGALGGMLRAVTIEKLRLRVLVASDDSAKTAISYGRVCAVLYPALGFITSEIKTKKKDINVAADFLGEKSSASFLTEISLIPIRVTNAGVAAAFKLLFKVIIKLFRGASSDEATQAKKKQKQEQKLIEQIKKGKIKP